MAMSKIVKSARLENTLKIKIGVLRVVISK